MKPAPVLCCATTPVSEIIFCDQGVAALHTCNSSGNPLSRVGGWFWFGNSYASDARNLSALSDSLAVPPPPGGGSFAYVIITPGAHTHGVQRADTPSCMVIKIMLSMTSKMKENTAGLTILKIYLTNCARVLQFMIILLQLLLPSAWHLKEQRGVRNSLASNNYPPITK